MTPCPGLVPDAARLGGAQRAQRPPRVRGGKRAVRVGRPGSAALPGAVRRARAGRGRRDRSRPAGRGSPGGGVLGPRPAQSCPPPELSGVKRALSSVVLLTARSTARVWTGPPSRGSRRGLLVRRRASRGGAKLRKTRSGAAAGLAADRLLLPPPSSRRARKRARPVRSPPGAGGPGPGPGRRSRGAGDRAGPFPERLRRPARGPGARPALRPFLPPAALGPERGTWVAARPLERARRGRVPGGAAQSSFWLVSAFVSFFKADVGCLQVGVSQGSLASVTWPGGRAQGLGPTLGFSSRSGPQSISGTRASSFVAHAMERLDCLSTWGLTRGPRHTWRVYLLEQRQDLGKIIVFCTLTLNADIGFPQLS